MLKKVEMHWRKSRDVSWIFTKWVVIAIFIGLIVGLVGIAFHWVLEMSAELQHEHDWLLWLLPVAGLLIVWSYHLCHMQNDRGTNFILVAVRANEKVTLKMAPLIFLSTALTHLFGGSAGREGAALQLGGSMASYIGRRLHLNQKDERIIKMCGMAAAFSALFGTPLTAVVFSMEVITVGIMHYSAFVPCIVASLVATELAKFVGFAPTSFVVSGIPEGLFVHDSIRVLVLAILCALVSILFCVCMEKVGHGYKKYLKNQYLRIFVGGVLVIAITYLIGNRDYNGAGMHVIQRAVGLGEANPEAFLLKILLTAVTLGAGFKGGEIVPTLFIGSTFGCVVGGILGLEPSFAAALGMIAVFCGVTNCPLASIVLSIELFGANGLYYYALCCAVSYMLSGYYGLYSEQKIMYSKVQPEFIDRNVS